MLDYPNPRFASYARICQSCANAVSLHNAYRAHIFTCSEQLTQSIMKNTFHIEQGTIYIRWRSKGGDYFYAPLGLVLKYGKQRIQYEININL